MTVMTSPKWHTRRRVWYGLQRNFNNDPESAVYFYNSKLAAILVLAGAKDILPLKDVLRWQASDLANFSFLYPLIEVQNRADSGLSSRP